MPLKRHSKTFQIYYSIIKMIKSMRKIWAGQVARMEAKRNVYRILMGKPEAKRLLGRSRRKCVDNIKMDLIEKYDEMVWTGLIRLRIGTSGWPF
jgi:hypothetical protein